MALDERQVRRARGIRIGNKFGEPWWLLLIRGVLALALGLAALLWPQATLALLVRLIGLYVLFDGAISLLSTVRSRIFGAYLPPGLVSVAIGLILLFWPDVTGQLLMMVVGFWALFQGAILFSAGRRSDPIVPGRGLAIKTGVAAAVVGLVLIIWPDTGIVTISWIIAAGTLLIGGLLISLSIRLRWVLTGVESWALYGVD